MMITALLSHLSAWLLLAAAPAPERAFLDGVKTSLIFRESTDETLEPHHRLLVYLRIEAPEDHELRWAAEAPRDLQVRLTQDPPQPPPQPDGQHGSGGSIAGGDVHYNIPAGCALEWCTGSYPFPDGPLDHWLCSVRVYGHAWLDPHADIPWGPPSNPGPVLIEMPAAPIVLTRE